MTPARSKPRHRSKIAAPTTDRESPEQEAQARGTIGLAPEGVVSLGVDGKIEAFNAAAEQIFGYRADEVRGTHFRLLLAPADREEYGRSFLTHIKSGFAPFNNFRREVNGRRKDGTFVRLQLVVTEVEDGGPHFVTTLHDVSDRYRLDQEIAKTATATQENLARELHDGIAQLITGIELTAAALLQSLQDDGSPQAPSAARLVEQAHLAQREIRSLIRGVHLHAVPADGLEAALRSLAKELEVAYGIRGSFGGRGRVKVESTQVATQLHYIAREAVFNAVKHSRCSRIAIRLDGDDERLLLTVRDDGIGFDPGLQSGMGIEIMRFRANLIGAAITFQPAHRGTVVRCSIMRDAGATG